MLNTKHSESADSDSKRASAGSGGSHVSDGAAAGHRSYSTSTDRPHSGTGRSGGHRPARSHDGMRSGRGGGYRSHEATRGTAHRAAAHHVSIDPGHAHKKAPQNENATRLVPLGGLEEIGRNMSFVEHKDEIVIIDMGIQFPEEETPGIDFIIPNVDYLAPKKANIRGLVLTHAHFDHVGAIPYLIGRIGNPTVYTTKLTKALIEKRQEEFVNAPKLNIVVVDNGDKVKLGKHIELEFFGVDHTVPDTIGVVVKTPEANIVHFADFRLDYDEEGNAAKLDDFERIGKLGIHTFMIDSTNAEKEGHSVSERLVEENLEKLFVEADGRIILTTFSTMLTRIAEIIKICEKIGRKVFVSGRSMKDAIQISHTLGYMKFKKDSVLPIEEIGKYDDDKILVLTTGAQGQSNAGLMKIVTGEHKYVQIKPGDTMIFSSSVIPGNERSVQHLKDHLTRQGAIVFNSEMIDIHSSGHAPKADLQTVVKLIKPKFLMPVHGYYFMRSANGKNAVEIGLPKENVRLMDNGQVAELTKETFTIISETVPATYVMVDGLGVGDVGEVVIRDRRILAQEGMVVVITTIDRKTGRVLKNPDIISRGFIYLKESQELLNEVRKKVRLIIGKIPPGQLDGDYLKNLMRDQIGQYLYNKTFRRPMILPVIIEI